MFGEKLKYAHQGNVEEISQKIKELTQKEEKIFVWGFMPQLYLRANRLPATRFIQCDPLTGMSRVTLGQFPGSARLWGRIRADLTGTLDAGAHPPQNRPTCPLAWPRFWKDMKENPARLIVDTSQTQFGHYQWFPPEKFPVFDRWLRENYQPVGKVHNFLFYVKKDSHWEGLYPF
jgi:hypothetical protein